MVRRKLSLLYSDNSRPPRGSSHQISNFCPINGKSREKELKMTYNQRRSSEIVRQAKLGKDA